MEFSLEDILNRCPLSVWIDKKNYITYEYSIYDSNNKLGIIYEILDSLTLFEIECLAENDNKLLRHCYDLFLHDANTLIDTIYLSHKIILRKDHLEIKNYSKLLANIILQNDILGRLIFLRSLKDKDKKQSNNTFDVLDQIISINALGILDNKLTISNWDKELTYRQYELFLQKVRNSEQKQQINQYISVLFAIAKGVGGDKTDFTQTILHSENKKFESETMKFRKDWFLEKYNDIQFIKEKLEKMKMNPCKFFTQDDIIKLNLIKYRKNLGE